MSKGWRLVTLLYIKLKGRKVEEQNLCVSFPPERRKRKAGGGSGVYKMGKKKKKKSVRGGFIQYWFYWC